ncbi:cobalt transporter CbiM [Campylobacterota bacterium]|nr:cobalt transporter CbiM [Campylobacterota bacterium]
MHISEGVLRPEILAIGWAVGGAAVGWSFYRLKNSEIPKTAALSALFFLASFAHVPIGIGGASAHLILSGFVGVFLGFGAFAAIGSALFLQGILFSFGGMTTFGVNICVLAAPALLGFLCARVSARSPAARRIALFLAGFLPILLGSALLSIVLMLNGEAFAAAAYLVFAAHIPIAVIEGVITLFACEFILKYKPSLLERR